MDRVNVPPLKTNDVGGFDPVEANMCKDSLDKFRVKEIYTDNAIYDQTEEIKRMNALHPGQREE